MNTIYQIKIETYCNTIPWGKIEVFEEVEGRAAARERAQQIADETLVIRKVRVGAKGSYQGEYINPRPARRVFVDKVDGHLVVFQMTISPTDVQGCYVNGVFFPGYNSLDEAVSGFKKMWDAVTGMVFFEELRNW